MATYYHSSGGGNNSNNNDWSSWIPIIILFCIPSPVTWVIAFFLLVSKLKGGNKKRNVKRHPYDLQQDAQQQWEQVNWEEQQAKQSAATQTRSTSTAQSGQKVYNSARSDSAKRAAKAAYGSGKKSAAKQSGNGNGFILGGAIMAAIFGMGAITTFVDALSWGGLTYELSGILACLMFMAGGLVMLGAGVGKKRRAERYLNYLGYIGTNKEVPLAAMAASHGVSVRKLCKDLRQMLSKGILPAGYLDLAEGKLFLTEKGYQAPKQEEKPAEEPVKQEQDDDEILREIRQVNDDIPDEEMSAKIDRIEEITRKILVYQKKHPNKANQLRSFLNYYLPTTLKILRAYAQLDAQGIEGENISAAKGRIEGMMDQVVAGFEKQLDKLFQDDALDIASDVKVLEDMLKKDGLSGGENMTMTL